MKRTTLIIALLCLMSSSLFAQYKDVLFLGNSYTGNNNLPKLVSDIASSLGDSVSFDARTPGGYTLEAHSTNSASIAKINARDWDVVVLQDQSQRPSFPPAQVAADVYPYARALDSLIELNDSCTKTMFYMTWGRKFGDALNCQFYAPLCTYLGMQQRLRTSYVQMAIDNQASVAPVGMAWKNSITADSLLNLYAADNSHPNIFGSYLTACVFYASIFHKSPVGAYYPASIPVGSAFFLQNIAMQTVFDSLSTWRIDTTGPDAFFTYMASDQTVIFNDSSRGTNLQYHWDFGDGQSSQQQDPVHTYADSGTYIVTLTVTQDCLDASFKDTIHVAGPVGLSRHEKNSKISLHPNPSDGIVNIEIPILGQAQLNIYDPAGRIVLSRNLTAQQGSTRKTIDLNGVQAGVYLVVVRTDEEVYQQRLVLN